MPKWFSFWTKRPPELKTEINTQHLIHWSRVKIIIQKCNLKFENFRENFIFANSVKRHITRVKIATLAWFTYISKGQRVFAISRGFYYRATPHARSFAKIKSSRKVLNLQYWLMLQVPYNTSLTKVLSGLRIQVSISVTPWPSCCVRNFTFPQSYYILQLLTTSHDWPVPVDQHVKSINFTPPTLVNHCTWTAKSSQIDCSRRGHKIYYLGLLWSILWAISLRLLVFAMIFNYHLGGVVHSGSIAAFKF